MRIAILSDFHLGYERFREDAYKQAEEALNKAAQVADVLVIPGDIFDNRTPKPDVLAEAFNIFRGISCREWSAQVIEFRGEGQHYTNRPIIAIPGTHERRAQDVMDPVDLLGLTGMVVDVSNATVIIQKGEERVAIVGIGGIADERFREIVAELRPSPVEGIFSIFMFHESVYEMLPFNESFIRQGELPKGFDLYVCGHIHSKVDSEVHGKKFLIPGSTVLTQLKPGEQERKGFYLYDTSTGQYEFVHISSRRFVVVKIDAVDIGRENAGMAFVEREIDRAVGTGGDRPVVRLVVEGAASIPSELELDLNSLPRRYKDTALIEVATNGMDADVVKIANSEMSAPSFKNMSVKDYGISVFMEKFSGKEVSFGSLSPIELLDMLSTEGGKDKVINNVLDCLLN